MTTVLTSTVSHAFIIVKAGDTVLIDETHELSRMSIAELGVDLFIGLTLLKIGVACKLYI